MIATWRRLAIAGVAVLTLASGVLAASATTIARTDPNDSRSPLDLRRLRVTHREDAEIFRISTHRAFRDRAVDGERGWLRIGFAGGDGWRRSVYVLRVDGGLRGVASDRDGDFLRFVPVRRIAGDRVAVTIPTAVSGGVPYRFAVWSVWNRRPCARTAPCIDWLPDRGTIRHAR